MGRWCRRRSQVEIYVCCPEAMRKVCGLCGGRGSTAQQRVSFYCTVGKVDYVTHDYEAAFLRGDDDGKPKFENVIN
jgi:hypothetical protein